MLRNIKLKNRIKKIISLHKEVDDVVLFGSIIRGKEKPNDIDILVIFKEKIDKEIELSIRKISEKEFTNVSIISKTQKTVIESSFDARESILFEGRSLLTGQTLAEKYGFSSLGMFKYNFSGWSNGKKTKFYYALNGRGNDKGISQKLHCIKFSDRVILVPLDRIEQFREFLNSWEIEFKYIPLIIPSRLNKRHLLE